MKINLTLFLSIVLATGIVTAAVTVYQVSGERKRLNSELAEKSLKICREFDKSARLYAGNSNKEMLNKSADELCRNFGSQGIALYTGPDSLEFSSNSSRPFLAYSGKKVVEALASGKVISTFFRVKGNYINQYILPEMNRKDSPRVIVVYTNASYIQELILSTWLRKIFPWLLQAILVALIAMGIIRWRILAPINKLVDWMKSARTGNTSVLNEKPSNPFLRLLHAEATRLTEALTEARAAAEEEANLRTKGESVWTPERLNAEARNILKDRLLIVISNREPYMHIHEGKEIRCIMPASGMVTAMEPILTACGGLWIASGSGDADQEVVDDHDKIKVPPEDPKYTLHRIWLSKEEEEHYYYGFANEGLWPLCHVVHTRPVFRVEDWEHYQKVNRKFAVSILEEIKNEEMPFILIQDYHFALLPAMIKESRPDARVSIFWHIPWPNPESFGICPWQNEILLGMLGADLIGFHTQYHVNNFLSTVNKALESRVTWENFSVIIGDHVTRVNPFPISIAFTLKDHSNKTNGTVTLPELLKDYGIQAKTIGIGVDRIDYTKGILERFMAIERFLEKNPSYQGNFTFVQIGAPSRTFIKSYSDLVENVEAEAERINRRFRSNGWKPILLLNTHHSHKEISPFYQLASLCMVTSLHDGMNLVAKEFVASRNNHSGVLILSRFTGAAQELSGSLIINPYDTEETADAIKTALEMSPEEQQFRMDQMRQIILRNNVYSWAAGLIKNMDAG